MKQILISIKPKWVAKILNREKTIEIRKTAPKEWADYLNGKTDKMPEPMIVNIYCTKGDYIGYFPKKYVGKVVAKFTLRKVEEIICRPICGEWESYTKTLGYSEISQASCLENKEIVHYLKGSNGCDWHISDLEIFDEPKKLSEFSVTKKYKSCDECPHYEYDGLWHCLTCEERVPLIRAPQSWCYVEERE